MKSIRNKQPSILIVEGLWGSGKSTLISRLRNRYSVLFVPEPNYQTSGIKKNVTEWYRKQHKQRMKLAIKYAQYGEHVIMERSILSSAAFYYAQHGQMPKWFSSVKSSLQSMPNLHIVFLFTKKSIFMSNIKYIKDTSVRTAIKDNENFYENYLAFFKKIDLDVRFINSASISKSSVIELYFRQIFHSSIKSKLKEIVHRCSSAVVIYKNKLLIIYAPMYKQFTLPQGHLENGENPTQTAIREVTEETGYIHFDSIQHIRTYSFRFFNAGKITKKLISCYLIILKDLHSKKKRLEKHEVYKNFLVERAEGLRMLNWPEDRDNVICAYDVLSTKKSHLLRKRD